MRTVMAACLLLCSGAAAYAQHKVGLGLVVGVPSGLSATVRLSPTSSANVQMAWRVESTFFAQAHYDFILSTLQRGQDHQVDFYGGPGLFLRLAPRQADLLGLSGNFGIRWLIGNHLELFSELAPKVGLLTRTEIDLTGGIGFRYIL